MTAATERGTALPIVVLLAAATLIVVALAADVARWGAAVREAAFAADTGAEAGAAVVSPAGLYQDRLLLDPAAAESTAVDAALTSRPRAGRAASASATVDRICVTVVQPFDARFLGPLGVAPSTIRVEACAVPARG